MTKRVIFIRPGETDWNRQGRWQGWVASPLNEHGRQQAAALAKYVRNIGMGALYTSDLRRALETAAIIAPEIGFAPIPDERLRERAVGLWQGLTFDEMRTWYADDYSAMLHDVDGYRIPGGESRADVRARIRPAFDAITSHADYETVGILTHTAAIKVLLANILTAYDPIELDLGNTSVTTIKHGENGWELVAADDVMHLEGLESRAITEIGDHT